MPTPHECHAASVKPTPKDRAVSVPATPKTSSAHVKPTPNPVGKAVPTAGNGRSIGGKAMRTKG